MKRTHRRTLGLHSSLVVLVAWVPVCVLASRWILELFDERSPRPCPLWRRRPSKPQVTDVPDRPVIGDWRMIVEGGVNDTADVVPQYGHTLRGRVLGVSNAFSVVFKRYAARRNDPELRVPGVRLQPGILIDDVRMGDVGAFACAHGGHNRFDHRELIRVAGRGFDARSQATAAVLVESLQASRSNVQRADLVLVSFPGYQLSEELQVQTATNATAIERSFATLGTTRTIEISASAAGEDDLSASQALRLGTERVLQTLTDETHVILDVGSLPRMAYLALMIGFLERLVPDLHAPNALTANGVTLQVLVAEDPVLDAKIQSEDPRNELVLIPGFASALQAESMRDLPLVWFPILGEGKVSHFTRVMTAAIPATAEICPILPHPSRDPRRADNLLVEYRAALFDSRFTPTTNIVYVHEAHPFEAYRQMLGAMRRYETSLRIVGGCRLVVTPLASKLITLGAGLACFEMRPSDIDATYGVAIPYAESTRYTVSAAELNASHPEISSLVLTGDAYDPSVPV